MLEQDFDLLDKHLEPIKLPQQFVMAEADRRIDSV
jgi:hypothetical protein